MLEKSPRNSFESNLAAPDDTDWAVRSEFWRTRETKPSRGARRKFKFREPLILCGHGVRLRVDHGALLIRNGFTHYPQKSEEIRFFPGDPNLPDRIIILDGSGVISLDALNWMSEQNVDFIRLDWRGQASSIGSISGYATSPKLVEAQNAIRNTRREIEIARKLISEKIGASVSTLQTVIPKSEMREKAISDLKIRFSKIRSDGTPISKTQLLGIEGTAAGTYFRAWQGTPINWSGIKKKPIPPQWLEIQSRTMAWRHNCRNARHPINAMLNYGYGVLANSVRAQIIAAGLDPAIGVLHSSRDNRIPLVYDLMEPLRPLVDCAVLRFAQTTIFAPGDFAINRWGGCRLNPQMAGVVAKQVLDIKAGPIVGEFVRSLR